MKLIRTTLIIVWLIACPKFSWAAFLQVQTSAQAAGTNQNMSITVTATGQSTLVVVHIKLNNQARTITSVTDNQSNTYVLSNAFDVGTSYRIYQAYGVQTTSGVTTITVNQSAAGNIRCGADEYSGGAATNAGVFDVTATGSDSSGNSSNLSATLNPTSSGELIVATLTTASNQTYTAGANYVLYNGTNPISTRSQYRLSGTTSETTPASLGANEIWGVIVSAFKVQDNSHKNIVSGNSAIIGESLLN